MRWKKKNWLKNRKTLFFTTIILSLIKKIVNKIVNNLNKIFHNVWKLFSRNEKSEAISEISIAQRFVQNLSENSVQSIELSASFKFKTRKRAWLNYLRESDSMAIDRSYVANETRPRIAVDRREESWPSEIYFDDEGQNKTFDFNRLKSTLWKRSKRVEESRKEEKEDERKKWKRKKEEKERLSSFSRTKLQLETVMVIV